MKRFVPIFVAFFTALLILPIACKKSNNPTTADNTPASTSTRTFTFTSTPYSHTMTPTATITRTATVTRTPTLTLTPTMTRTPSLTPTVTTSPTVTLSPTMTTWPTPRLVATWGSGTYGSVRGIAAQGSNLFVADGVGNTVHKYNLQGTPVAGWTEPSVNSAWGVALDSGSNIYVTSNSDDYLHKFNASATPVATWYAGTSGGNVISDSSDNIWIGTSMNYHEIQQFTSAGVSISTFYPVDTWIFGIQSSGTTVFAGGVNTMKVEMFDMSGTSLGSWDSYSDNLAMALSPAGNLYVAGDGNIPVKLYTPTGGLLVEWGSFNSSGMAVDSSGNIYVGNYSAGAVYKYQP